MLREQQADVPGGGILYDASVLRKPDTSWFTREYWSAQHALLETPGGRGTVCFLRTGQGNWVLRHYRRGGLMAAIAKDRYLWLGAGRTRSYAEWRLLAELRRRELPVPHPIAARYLRHGLTYTADLITAELPESHTLASFVGSSNALPMQRWQEVGRTIARFHAQGVYHADLNAHNILLGLSEVYLLDFDRGRIRARGSWENAVLARLRRSLQKIGAQRGVTSLAKEWSELSAGYRTAMR